MAHVKQARVIFWCAMKVLAFLVIGLWTAGAADYYPPPDAQGGWRTLAKADDIQQLAGMEAAKLDAAFEYTKDTTQHGGLLVVRHGYLVYEKYFGRGDREAVPELASCGKAFTSIAVGIGLKEKAELIPDGVNQKVFTPKYMPAEIFPLDDPRKADITLGQLLAMSAGIRGVNPVYVHGEKQTWDSPSVDGPIATTDPVALHEKLWCAPGDCYSYATSSPHLASIVLRRLVGMEMEQYIRLKIAEPLGFGTWGYAMYRPKLKAGITSEGRLEHTPGGGSIAVRSTDVLRFVYLLLHEGKWGDQQIVPASFVRMCGKLSPYNPHFSHSFNFNVNEDGHVAGVPKDAYWKAGAGGYCMYVVPSLDMVIYKMGGNEGQYDPKLTGIAVKYKYDGSRDGWKPDKKVGDATAQTLQLVVAAVLK
ncbi:MAG: Beta-lactamase [Bryobacterales bacterium]|nr:Beta-lactamase [Bryobacterales bacterium]